MFFVQKMRDEHGWVFLIHWKTRAKNERSVVPKVVAITFIIYWWFYLFLFLEKYPDQKYVKNVLMLELWRWLRKLYVWFVCLHRLNNWYFYGQESTPYFFSRTKVKKDAIEPAAVFIYSVVRVFYRQYGKISEICIEVIWQFLAICISPLVLSL